MGIYSDEPNAVISGHDFGGNAGQQEALAAARSARATARAARAARREATATTEGGVNTGRLQDRVRQVRRADRGTGMHEDERRQRHGIHWP